MTNTVVLPVSIIIPTYCEEIVLPVLLESIKKQRFAPSELIVADANSNDKTREIASTFGCIVVEGGKSAVGRNSGAKVASSPYLLFLDADTEFPNEYALGDVFMQFIQNGADIASTHYAVSQQEKSFFAKTAGAVLWSGSNIIRSIQSVFSYPKWEGGAFIMVKKSVFDKISGFNESLAIGEDVVFFKDAVKKGFVYKHLTINVATSMRRYATPKKLVRALGWAAIETVVLSLGVVAGAKTLRKYWKLYGRLGGGEGKDPSQE